MREPVARLPFAERVASISPSLALSPEAQAERDRVRAELDARKLHAERDTRWRALCVRLGARYANATLGGFQVASDEQRAAVEEIVGYVGELERNVREGRGLVLFGPKGTGKDHLLCAVMRRAVLTHGFSVKWANGMDLFGDLRDQIDGEQSESRFVKLLAEPSILAISDPVPPVGGLTGWQMSQLFRVIDRRYRDLKPIFVTLNATSGGDAEDRMSGQIVDRLRDGTLVIHCNWPSYRKAK